MSFTDYHPVSFSSVLAAAAAAVAVLAAAAAVAVLAAAAGYAARAVAGMICCFVFVDAASDAACSFAAAASAVVDAEYFVLFPSSCRCRCCRCYFVGGVVAGGVVSRSCGIRLGR